MEAKKLGVKVYIESVYMQAVKKLAIPKLGEQSKFI